MIFLIKQKKIDLVARPAIHQQLGQHCVLDTPCHRPVHLVVRSSITIHLHLSVQKSPKVIDFPFVEALCMLPGQGLQQSKFPEVKVCLASDQRQT